MPQFRAEVIELHAVRKVYVVEAPTKGLAQQKLLRGETVEEIDMGGDEIRERHIVSDTVEEVVHLSLTRGGTVCGGTGQIDADINRVTCRQCRILHDSEEGA